MFGQRGCHTVCLHLADCPDVAVRDPRDRKEVVVLAQIAIRADDDTPGRPIPVLDKRARATAGRIKCASDRPGTDGREGEDAREVPCRTRPDTPAGAIPMLEVATSGRPDIRRDRSAYC